MRALGRVIDRLAAGALPRLADKMGTDSFFVLRAGAGVPDGRGNTRKGYAATTAEALSAFGVSVVAAHGADLEKIVAERKVPLVFRRVVCAARVDCTTKDRLRIEARGETPRLDDLEVVRSVLLSGAVREIITVEEQRVAS